MTLVKWTPKRGMLNCFEDVDRMISQAFSHPSEEEYDSRSFVPLMNVNESDLEYTVYLDLPGIECLVFRVGVMEVITVCSMFVLPVLR